MKPEMNAAIVDALECAIAVIEAANVHGTIINGRGLSDLKAVLNGAKRTTTGTSDRYIDGHDDGWNTAMRFAAGASEGQAEPVAWRYREAKEDRWRFTRHSPEHWSRPLPFVEPLYTRPSAEIAALRERIAGMEKDAEDAARYRWLEGQAKCDPKMGGNHHWWGINLRGVHGPTLAIGIDAAIAKEPNP